MYITAIGTVVMAAMTVIMGYSLFLTKESLTLTRTSVGQTAESLALAHTAVSLQQQEFMLRNRPFITVNQIEFSGPGLNMNGQNSPHTVRYILRNLADIPANNVAGFAVALLDGKEIHRTTIVPAALPKDDLGQYAYLSISEDQYSLATNQAHKLQVNVEITYGGMLKENQACYRTRLESHYSPVNNTFKFTHFEFE